MASGKSLHNGTFLRRSQPTVVIVVLVVEQFSSTPFVRISIILAYAGPNLYGALFSRFTFAPAANRTSTFDRARNDPTVGYKILGGNRTAG